MVNCQERDGHGRDLALRFSLRKNPNGEQYFAGYNVDQPGILLRTIGSKRRRKKMSM